MNIPKTIAIIILVVGIFTIGYLYAKQTTPIIITPQPQVNTNPTTPVIQPQNKTGCFLIDDTGQRDVCLYKEPITKWNCTQFTDFDLTIKCYQATARYYKNPQLCIPLHNDYDRDNCYLGVANDQNNPVICMAIMFPDIRQSCYKKINLKGIDPDICNSGWTVDTRHECRIMIEEEN